MPAVMEWDHLPRPARLMAITEPGGDPLPILEAGQTAAGRLWAWTGDFNHLLRFPPAAEYVETTGDQGEIREGDQVLAYIAPADDVPEIVDFPTWAATAEGLRMEADTDDFRSWLEDEIRIT